MRLPAIKGVIDRRILANYRVDPEYMARVLPRPFRSKLVGGFAIGGICLIRLKQVRPKRLPISWGLGSENAAHRIAVEWDTDDGVRQGVYVPRRDTDSRLVSWAGGRVFPGVQHHASFKVEESQCDYSVTMTSDDGEARVHVSGKVADEFPASSVFDSLSDASTFFENGALGYSDTKSVGRFDGLELQCQGWNVETLDVERVESSYFDDVSVFPDGVAAFDCALLMREIVHEWHGQPDLCCGVG